MRIGAPWEVSCGYTGALEQFGSKRREKVVCVVSRSTVQITRRQRAALNLLIDTAVAHLQSTTRARPVSAGTCVAVAMRFGKLWNGDCSRSNLSDQTVDLWGTLCRVGVCSGRAGLSAKQPQVSPSFLTPFQKLRLLSLDSILRVGLIPRDSNLDIACEAFALCPTRAA